MLSSSDIVLGQPLRFSVYNQVGKLLLRRGFVVTHDAQIKRLAAEGIFRDLSETTASKISQGQNSADKLPVYPIGSQLCSRVKNLFANVLDRSSSGNAMETGLEIASSIQDACIQDADALLAALHIDISSDYLLVHTSLTGVLAEVAGKMAGVEKGKRCSLIAAAITHDIAQRNIISELDLHEGPLTSVLKDQIESHPINGVELLKKAGVIDSVWLDAVAGHHERLDGSGYPRKLNGSEINDGALLLAVCDVYSAMIKPRPYRSLGKASFTQAALREIYLSSGKLLDKKYSESLIKAIGILPAGSIVRLKCGEIAVVKNGGHNLKNMTVYSIYNSRQTPMLLPVARETSEPEFAISGMAHYVECRSVQQNLHKIWCN